MALSQRDLRELREALTDGIREGFENANTSGGGGTSNPRGTSGGSFIPDEERRNREIERILKENDAIRSGAHGNTALGQDRIRENDERVERLRNGGISEKDAKRYKVAKSKAKFSKAKDIVGMVKQIADMAIEITFAIKRYTLEGQKNFFEYSQKLIEADAQYRNKQISAMTTTFNAFTTQIATDAAFSSEKTLGGEVMANFTKNISGQKASGEFKAAEARRDAKLAKNIGSSVGNTLMAAGAVMAVVPAIGWVAGAITAGIGAIISIGTKLFGESKEFEAEQTEQINKQFDAQTQAFGQSFENTCKLIEQIDDYAKKIVDYSMKNDESYKQMGMTTGFTGDRYASYGRKMSEALSKTFNITAQQAKQMFDSYSTESGRTMLLNERDYGNIKAVGRGFGISEGETSKIMGHMNLFNQSIASGASMLTKEWKQITKMGLSSTKYAKDLDKNLKLAEKHNFKGGIQGMMKLTKWAQQTRFNIDSAVSFAEKLQNGDLSENIETSARLQVLGGSAATYSDPLGMMFDAWNDVGSLAERQAKMFDDITGTFDAKTGETKFTGYENMRIAQIAKALGMDVGEAKNMIRERDKQKQVGKVLNDYNNLDEETKTAIGNRAKWNRDKGSWEVETRNGTMSLADVAALTNAQREEILMPENEEEALFDIAEDTRSIREKMEANLNAAYGKKEREMHGDVVSFAERTTRTQTDLLNSAVFGEQAKASLDAIATNMEVRTNALEKFMNEGGDLIKDVRNVLNIQARREVEITTFVKGAVEFMKDPDKYGKILYDVNKDLVENPDDYTAAGLANYHGKQSGEGARLVVRAANGLNDGTGETNGGLMLGASSVKPINDGGVNVGFAKKDQYLAAMPNGPIDKILQQLIPGLQALLRGNGSSNGSLNLNVNGRIDLEDSGSTVNIVELIKNNPKIASQLVSIIKRTMEVNSTGKPIRSYM